MISSQTRLYRRAMGGAAVVADDPGHQPGHRGRVRDHPRRRHRRRRRRGRRRVAGRSTQVRGRGCRTASGPTYSGRVADELDKRTDEMADAMVAEMGSPITQAKFGQVPVTSELLRYYAEKRRLLRVGGAPAHVQRHERGFDVMVQQAPYGVVGAIPPWNGPQICGMMKYAPALLAGLHDSGQAVPGGEPQLRRLRRGLRRPPAFRAACSTWSPRRGDQQVSVSHPDVDKVAFTGSVEVAGRSARHCHADASGHLNSAASPPPSSATTPTSTTRSSVSSARCSFVSGQACNALSRILARPTGTRSYRRLRRRRRQAAPRPAYRPRNGRRPHGQRGQKKRAALRRDRQEEGARSHSVAVSPKASTRLVRRQDRVPGRRQLDADRAGGDLRSRAVHHQVRGRRRRAAHRQRFLLGLAGSVWTADIQKGYEMAGALRSGCSASTITASTPPLPLRAARIRASAANAASKRSTTTSPARHPRAVGGRGRSALHHLIDRCVERPLPIEKAGAT